MAMLDEMDSHVHLKIAYDNDVRKPIILDANLRTTRCICDNILINLLTTTTMSEEALEGVNMVYLDVREDEIIQFDMETLKLFKLIKILSSQ